MKHGVDIADSSRTHNKKISYAKIYTHKAGSKTGR